MTKFKKALISSLFGLSILIGFSQNHSGKVTYMYKAKVNIKVDSSKYDQSMRNKIAGFFTKQFEKEFELTFNKHKSSYRVKTKISIQGTSVTNDNTLYKNVQNKEYKHQVELLGKLFLIEDSLKNFEWKTHSETKKIAKFTCHKATSIDKEGRETIAWYTMEIPVASGPDKFWGLPGLILEVLDDKIHIACKQIDVSNKKVKVPKRGKSITQEKYDKLKKQKDAERDIRLKLMNSLEEERN